jgi:hypothetical protein
MRQRRRVFQPGHRLLPGLMAPDFIGLALRAPANGPVETALAGPIAERASIVAECLE